MAIILAHRVKLYPNNAQATYFVKACGVSRFAYNWALSEWKRLHTLGEKVSEGELRKKLNAIKRESFPWMLEVTKCAPQLAIKDLGVAFKNFFEGRTSWPQFKRKGRHESFRISNDQFAVEGKKIRIPNLGWVRLAEPLRFEGKILGAAISRKVDEWYVSIQVEMTDYPSPHRGDEELTPSLRAKWEGGENLLTVVDETETTTAVPGPKAHRPLLNRLNRLHRSLSRKVGRRRTEPKSRNYLETRKEVAKLCVRVANIRQDALHKLTTKWAKEYGSIRVENSAPPREPKGFVLPRVMGDISFCEFRRQLEYKAKLTGSSVTIRQGLEV